MYLVNCVYGPHNIVRAFNPAVGVYSWRISTTPRFFELFRMYYIIRRSTLVRTMWRERKREWGNSREPILYYGANTVVVVVNCTLPTTKFLYIFSIYPFFSPTYRLSEKFGKKIVRLHSLYKAPIYFTTLLENLFIIHTLCIDYLFHYILLIGKVYLPT